jgi:outer membrane protein, multidrug efflux system
MRLRALLLTGLAALLSACVMGPNYKRPPVPAPSQFRGGPASPTSASIAETKATELFADETLKQLVADALGKNFDLRIAAERVEQARALYGIARANLLPTLDLQAQFTAARSSSVGSARFLPRGTNLATSYTQGGLLFAWELDLWGRIRRENEAARARYLATEEARHGVMLSLASEVMDTYFGLREQDLELEISRKTGMLAADSLRLVQVRHDRGAATALDVHQAEQLLYISTSQVARAQRQIGLAEDALSMLLGNVPGEIPRGKTLEEIALPPEIPAGLPSSLLERRPDIRQTEDNLIAANAEIGAARALLFPRVSLTGLYGAQARGLSNLISGPARLQNFGPSAMIPIFHAGLQSGVRLTEAQQREALLSYQKTIYEALREVADALIAHDRTREQRLEQEKLVQALSESVRLSTLRYQGGLDSYLQVLDAQRNLFTGELNLAQLRLLEIESIIQIYRALGGGWQ